jgi:cobalamin synthase
MSITNVLSFKTTDMKLIDARGPRFGAVITTLVLTAFLLTENLFLLHWQLAVFALGAFFGLSTSPYAFIYSKLIKPRLRGEVPTEDVRPPQFAQLVGFLFAISATILYDLGLSVTGMIVVGFALAAAFLNAAFNYCLGCEVYLLIARAKSAIASRKSKEDSYNLPSL